MNLEDQVTSLELSKKLFTLGVKQNSLFYWGEVLTGRHSETEFKIFYSGSVSKTYIIKEYSAFTSSELLDMLPKYIDAKHNEPFNNFIFNMQMSFIVLDDNKSHKCYSINYHCDTVQFETGSPHFALTLFKHNIYDKSLSNAAAKTLIYLIENGYVKNE